VHLRRASLPWILGVALVLAVVGPALDPHEQLYYRDTLRCAYHFKQFIAQQLHAGHSPFWDPWTEAGTSVLVQITPGLLHPLTLLYLLLPFELAFKLNHLVAIPLAWAGLYLLARKTGASAWGAAAGACGYAACGYLPSVVSSNLHYALGAGMMPLTLHAFFRFAERPRPLRLLWAGYALALCFYGGEPQSMLLAGVIGAVWLAGAAVLRRTGVVRSLAQTAAWGLCALLLAAPAITPVLARLSNTVRSQGAPAGEREAFANAPVRLAGLFLPWAFDDTQESSFKRQKSTYGEYFSGLHDEAFIDSIVLGAPILLLAFAAGRKGRFALLGALVLALASTGDSFRVLHLLQLVIPGLNMFRYAEKFIAPASMLVCLAAAYGVTVIEEKPATTLGLALGAAVALALLWLGLRTGRARFIPWLQAHGQSGGEVQAQQFALALGKALLFEEAMVLLLAALVFVRTRRPGFPLAAAVAALCAFTAHAQTAGNLYTASLEVLHAPLLVAEELKAVAGPSEGRWRIRGEGEAAPLFDSFDLRVGHMQATAQSLGPQFHALAQIEGISEYTSLGDRDYTAAVYLAPAASNQILGVRFDLKSLWSMTRPQAAKRGYRAAAFGVWVKQFPDRPRAFLAGCARPLTDLRTAVEWLASARFRIDEAVVRTDVRLPCPAQVTGEASLKRLGADTLLVRAEASAPSLVMVAEHFDPGWRATVDGKPADVLQADLAAMAVAIPAGRHEVKLHFVPHLLWLGLLLCGACVLALSLLELLHRDHRVGAAKAE
jgi:membrane protein YfhO